MLVKMGLDEAILLRKRVPQLHAVQCCSVIAGIFGVGDPVSGAHEIDFARANQCPVSGGVDVVNPTIEKPRDGSQTGMWVTWYLHAAGLCDVVGPKIIEETPCANQRASSLRNSALHRHRAWPTQRHRTRLKHLDNIVGAAFLFETGAEPIGVIRGVEVNKFWVWVQIGHGYSPSASRESLLGRTGWCERIEIRFVRFIAIATH